jgi:hypothetical protein
MERLAPIVAIVLVLISFVVTSRWAAAQKSRTASRREAFTLLVTKRIRDQEDTEGYANVTTESAKRIAGRGCRVMSSDRGEVVVDAPHLEWSDFLTQPQTCVVSHDINLDESYECSQGGVWSDSTAVSSVANETVGAARRCVVRFKSGLTAAQIGDYATRINENIAKRSTVYANLVKRNSEMSTEIAGINSRIGDEDQQTRDLTNAIERKKQELAQESSLLTDRLARQKELERLNRHEADNAQSIQRLIAEHMAKVNEAQTRAASLPEPAVFVTQADIVAIENRDVDVQPGIVLEGRTKSVSNVDAPDLMTCLQKCRETPPCRVARYESSSGSCKMYDSRPRTEKDRQEGVTTMFLHDNIGRPIVRAPTTSSKKYRVLQGYDCTRGDTQSATHNVSTFAECSKKCDEEAWCTTFTQTRPGRCVLNGGQTECVRDGNRFASAALV